MMNREILKHNYNKYFYFNSKRPNAFIHLIHMVAFYAQVRTTEMKRESIIPNIFAGVRYGTLKFQANVSSYQHLIISPGPMSLIARIYILLSRDLKSCKFCS